MAKQELSSTLKGQIAAYLVGIACAQGSKGRINFAFPFVDDEGVDLIFFKKGGSGKAILAQVKSRTTQSKKLSQGVFRADVKRASFKPREGYCLIFVAFDQSTGRLFDTLWLVPSIDFRKKLVGQKGKKVLVFQSRFNSKDMWEEYRISLKELPRQIARLMR